eukprot:TRINITY_DN3286_c0_g2_i1.p1 TRINITY_DN3286_c0_g2~~TRINITY_DN3286_c0_g2_i1.p1  ORF type:complete len:705 (-),score=188.15 TRINITY_DN3286_c0_g2_i1:64-1980(-)
MEDILDKVTGMVKEKPKVAIKSYLDHKLWNAKCVVLNCRSLAVLDRGCLEISPMGPVLEKLVTLNQVPPAITRSESLGELIRGCFQEDIRDCTPAQLYNALKDLSSSFFADTCLDDRNHPVVSQYIHLKKSESFWNSGQFFYKYDTELITWYTLYSLTSYIKNKYKTTQENSWKVYLPTHMNVMNLIPDDLIQLDHELIDLPSYKLLQLIVEYQLRHFYPRKNSWSITKDNVLKYMHQFYKKCLSNFSAKSTLLEKACLEHNFMFGYLVIGSTKKQSLVNSKALVNLFINPNEEYEQIFGIATALIKTKLCSLNDTVQWKVYVKGEWKFVEVSSLYFALKRKEEEIVRFLLESGIKLELEEWMEEIWGDGVEEQLESLRKLQTKHIKFEESILKKDPTGLKRAIQQGGGPFTLYGDDPFTSSLSLIKNNNPNCLRIILEHHPTINAILSSLIHLVPKEIILHIIQFCDISFNESFVSSFICESISRHYKENLQVITEFGLPSLNILSIAIKQNPATIPTILKLDLKPMPKYNTLWKNLPIRSQTVFAVTKYFLMYLECLEVLRRELLMEKKVEEANSISPLQVLLRYFTCATAPNRVALVRATGEVDAKHLISLFPEPRTRQFQTLLTEAVTEAISKI